MIRIIDTINAQISSKSNGLTVRDAAEESNSQEGHPLPPKPPAANDATPHICNGIKNGNEEYVWRQIPGPSPIVWVNECYNGVIFRNLILSCPTCGGVNSRYCSNCMGSGVEEVGNV